MSNWKISFNWINQLGPFVKFWTRKDYNWIDFSPIWINLEYGGYKGRYFEFIIIILGIGFGFEIYHKRERKEFVEPMLEQIKEWQEGKDGR